MKTKIIIILSALLFNSYTAQIQIPEDNITIEGYPTFYTQTVNKLNNIIPNKTYYYGKSLSTFLQVLKQNNIFAKEYDPGPYDNKLLKLSFLWNRDIDKLRMQYNYANPYVLIYFQHPFDYQQAVSIMKNGYHSYWNPQAENFFKDLIVEKIEFWYVNGLTDKNSPPK